MAKIWPVYEGKEPTIGEPWARIPASEAVTLFELRHNDFVSDLAPPRPRFGDVDRDLTYAGHKHIVVEIERDEGEKAKWKPGFYKSRVKPNEAFRRLIHQVLATELGRKNVVRLEFEPTTDSRGQEALKITVVIPPRATKKLKGASVLDALVKLQDRLREMHENRTPIVEYATEAELKRDGSRQS